MDVPESIFGSSPSAAGSCIAHELSDVAARLRRSTVQVRGGSNSGGAGVIWRADGIIMTNAHVLHGAARVLLPDGRSFAAPLLRRDARSDLAALRIPAHGLPAADLGDAAQLRTGQIVIAVGHPLGLVGAISVGIVHSAALPAGQALPARPRWVQADIRLAPGNSGGPLADVAGRVIGINSMIVAGLGFAVPSSAVEDFLEDLSGTPSLGVTTQPVSIVAATRTLLGLLVLEIVPGSPAERAEVKIGDVLISASGLRFLEPEDLRRALHKAGFGGMLSLDVLRGGRWSAVNVALGGALRAARAA